MKFRIYIQVEGPGFDARGFQTGLGKSLGGDVKERKRLGEKSSASSSYWTSKEVCVASEYPEEKLLELLDDISPALASMAENKSVKITAAIVAEYKNSDSFRGFYISSNLIKALAKLQADLDIDAVYELRK